MRRFRSLLLLVAAAQAVRVAVRMACEVVEQRGYSAELRTDWTVIPAQHKSGLLRIHARVGGHATVGQRVAVLVHGYGVGTSYLIPFAARVSRHMHALAPDLPGHGVSDHDAHPLTIPELADALGAWMDVRDLRAALLVGHSLGCQIVAELAARRPELASAVVLIAPTSDPSGRSVTHLFLRGMLTTVFERPSYVIWAALDYRRAGIRLLAHEMTQMLTHRIEEVLPHIVAPTQVVRGARDRLVPKRWADAAANLVGAPESLTVSGWGHAVQYDDPAAVARLAVGASEN